MEQFYKIVLELYKQALQGSLGTEVVEATQVLLAKEITKEAHEITRKAQAQVDEAQCQIDRLLAMLEIKLNIIPAL